MCCLDSCADRAGGASADIAAVFSSAFIAEACFHTRCLLWCIMACLTPSLQLAINHRGPGTLFNTRLIFPLILFCPDLVVTDCCCALAVGDNGQWRRKFLPVHGGANFCRCLAIGTAALCDTIRV